MFGPGFTSRLPVHDKLKLNFYQASGISGLLSVSIAHNIITRRPPSSSVLKHVLSGVAGYYLGCGTDYVVEERRKTKILIVEDYIKQHPEDFPIAEPKKTYGEMLLTWRPVRN